MSVWNDLRTCTIMTRAANDTVEPIQDRMPVILGTDERDEWLAGSGDLELGVGYRVKHHPVAKFGISDDGEGLIEPV